MSSRIGHHTWTEVERHDTVLIPLGSTEQHGPHLPLDTDSRIAHAVAHRAAVELDCAVAPVLAYGASGEHADFPGTLSIGTDVLRTVVVELVRSARQTFDRVVFVNGHGGNHPALRGAVDQMVDEGHRVRAWWPSIPGGDAHAGHTETSLLLAISPDVVQLDRAEAGNTAALIELLPQMQSGGVRAVSSNGVLGDPTGASADDGRRMLGELVADLVQVVQRWR